MLLFSPGMWGLLSSLVKFPYCLPTVLRFKKKKKYLNCMKKNHKLIAITEHQFLFVFKLSIMDLGCSTKCYDPYLKNTNEFWCCNVTRLGSSQSCKYCFLQLSSLCGSCFISGGYIFLVCVLNWWIWGENFMI